MTPASPPDDVIHCTDLDAEVESYERRGAQLEAIWPADDPRHAIVRVDGRVLQLVVDRPSAAVDVGERRLLLSRPGDDVVTGRAGMQYRDLIPGRLGGRYIASSIRITQGGAVPDYVHHHDVEFQMIFCAAGWVRVVYEDQGPPFVLQPGDCVLQPPGIRHRVLEASAGLEVIEVSSPAAHVTFRDHSLSLPTGKVRPDRRFGGQGFVHHVSASGASGPWRGSALPARDVGLTSATNGLARVAVVGGADVDHVRADVEHVDAVADADLTFFYVLAGSVVVEAGGSPVVASAGVGLVVPPGWAFRLTSWTADLSLLDVAVGLSD
jgi:quercetin dioxygenase-like cupin family protein